MPHVEIYADRHDSEKYAKRIHERMERQEPDGLFLESDDKSNASYRFVSLSNYPTLGRIFGAFDAELEDAGIGEKYSKKGLWMLDYKILKRSLEYLFRYTGEKPTTPNMAAIKESDQTWKSKKVDEAMHSLLHQMSIRESDDRSTLWSRLAPTIGRNGIEVIFIDMDRSRIWRYGAKNISQLPDDPVKVKKAYKLTRNGEQNPYVAGVKKLVNSSMDARDEAMAIQVKNTVESKGLKNSAVVVGRDHVEGIARLLEDEFKVSITDVG